MHTTDADGGEARRGRHELRADRLRDLLRQRGITQTELARRMGIDRGHLSGVMHGRWQLGRQFMDGLRSTFPDDYDHLVVWTGDTDTDTNAAPAAPHR